MALADSYCVNACRLPITPMLLRLSIAASTSGGSEMFSTTKLQICSPNVSKSG